MAVDPEWAERTTLEKIEERIRRHRECRLEAEKTGDLLRVRHHRKSEESFKRLKELVKRSFAR